MESLLHNLDPKEIDAIIKKYRSGEKVAKIIQEHKLQVKPYQLLRALPPERIEDKCPYCNNSLYVRVKGRNYRGESTAECLACFHKMSSFCECDQCHLIRINKEKDELNRTRLRIRNLFPVLPPVEYENLTAKEKIYLGAMLREGISDDYERISPVNSFLSSLAPTQQLLSEILNDLYSKGIIVVHEDSDLNSILLEYKEDKVLNKSEVIWKVNLFSTVLTYNEIIRDLYMPTQTPTSSEVLLDTWKHIALHEVLEYLKFILESVFFVSFSAGAKSIAVIETLLKDYSVGQIFTIIYSCSGYAAVAKNMKGLQAKHAANGVISRMLSYGEKGVKENWQIRNSYRPAERQQSALSSYFFYSILGVGEAGFNKVPSLENIRSMLNE